MGTRNTMVVFTTSNENLYDKKFFEPIGPNGEILLEYNLFNAIEAGFEKIILVVADNMKCFVNRKTMKRFKNKVELHCINTKQQSRFSLSKKIARDTFSPNAYAIWKVKRHLKGSFLAIDGRFYHGKNLYRHALDFLRNDTEEIAVINYPLNNTLSRYGGVDRGICVTQVTGDHEVLQQIMEFKKIRMLGNYIMHEHKNKFELSGEMAATTGAFCLNHTFFNAYGTIVKSRGDNAMYTIPALINHLLENMKCSAKSIKIEAKGFGISHKPDRIMAMHKIKEMIAQNYFPNSAIPN